MTRFLGFVLAFLFAGAFAGVLALFGYVAIMADNIARGTP